VVICADCSPAFSSWGSCWQAAARAGPATRLCRVASLWPRPIARHVPTQRPTRRVLSEPPMRLGGVLLHARQGRVRSRCGTNSASRRAARPCSWTSGAREAKPCAAPRQRPSRFPRLGQMLWTELSCSVNVRVSSILILARPATANRAPRGEAIHEAPLPTTGHRRVISNAAVCRSTAAITARLVGERPCLFDRGLDALATPSLDDRPHASQRFAGAVESTG